MSETLPEPQTISGSWDVNPDRKPPESADEMLPAPGFTREDAEKVHAIWTAEYEAAEQAKQDAKDEEEAAAGQQRYDTGESEPEAQPQSAKSKSSSASSSK